MRIGVLVLHEADADSCDVIMLGTAAIFTAILLIIIHMLAHLLHDLHVIEQCSFLFGRSVISLVLQILFGLHG